MILPLQSVELWRYRCYVELLFQFSTAIFKGFIVKEYYVRFWELSTCFPWNPYVYVFVQCGWHKSDFVIFNDFLELFFSIVHDLHIGMVGCSLKSDFHSWIVLVKLNLIISQQCIFFDLLKEMLTMKPNHLNWSQFNAHFTSFFITLHMIFNIYINFFSINKA